MEGCVKNTATSRDSRNHTYKEQYMRCKQRAFTLVEVIVALGIFTIGVIVLFPLFSSGLALSGEREARMTVASLAREVMSEIEANGFESAPANVPRTTFPSPHQTYAYEVQWTALREDVALAGATVLFKVECRIYWRARSGEKSETFITYVSKRT